MKTKSFVKHLVEMSTGEFVFWMAVIMAIGLAAIHRSNILFAAGH